MIDWYFYNLGKCLFRGDGGGKGLYWGDEEGPQGWEGGKSGKSGEESREKVSVCVEKCD